MPQPDSPTMRPQPNRCLHCGYARDPVAAGPCCPECGSDYPTDLEAEIRVLRSAKDLRRVRIVMLIGSALGLPAALGFAFPEASMGPQVILLGLAVYAGVTTLLGTMLAAAILCLGLARSRKTLAAYRAASPATQAMFDQARRSTQRALLCLIVAVIVVACAILRRAILAGWLDVL